MMLGLLSLPYHIRAATIRARRYALVVRAVIAVLVHIDTVSRESAAGECSR